ncbi:MAG: hypothetical protein J7L15_04150 [Clostridiales bacterium]|nr:hypothetical protein [Clostridiales bacterium]
MEEENSIVTVQKDDCPINNIVPYIPADDRITKKSCKLCNFEFRDEAEERFMNQRIHNFNDIFTFVKSKGFDGSWFAVKNHLVRHFKNPKDREFLIEYAEDVQKWIKSQPDKMFSLRKRIAMLDREMFLLAAESDNLPNDERRKNADSIKKLADTLLNFESKLDDYQKSLEPATVVINHLKLIITDEVQHVSSRESKKVLVNVLERMQDQVGDLIVEEPE